MTAVDSLPPEEQFKVFWLQEHLYKNGIEGIHFRDVMVEYLEDDAEDDIEATANQILSRRTF
jgi:hypothetical protein